MKYLFDCCCTIIVILSICICLPLQCPFVDAAPSASYKIYPGYSKDIRQILYDPVNDTLLIAAASTDLVFVWDLQTRTGNRIFAGQFDTSLLPSFLFFSIVY